jgi:hypothetical protein
MIGNLSEGLVVLTGGQVWAVAEEDSGLLIRASSEIKEFCREAGRRQAKFARPRFDCFWSRCRAVHCRRNLHGRWGGGFRHGRDVECVMASGLIGNKKKSTAGVAGFFLKKKNCQGCRGGAILPLEYAREVARARKTPRSSHTPPRHCKCCAPSN